MYCEPEDVEDIIETSLDPDQIARMIYRADKRLDKMIAGLTLDADDLKECSMYLTAIMIEDRQPTSYTVGSATIRKRNNAARWEKKVQGIIDRNKTPHIGESEYRKINEDIRYPS